MLFINDAGEEFEVDPQDESAAREEGLKRAFTFKDKKAGGEEIIVPEDKLNRAQEAGLTATGKDLEEIGSLEAGARGLGSSLSFGLSDEIVGGLKAGYGKLTGAEESFSDLYQKERDLERLRNEAAYEEQTGAYGTGFAGGLIGNPLASIGRGAAKLAGIGASKIAQAGVPSVASIAGKGAVGGAVAGAGGGAGLGGADLVGGEPGEAGAFASQVGMGALTGGAVGGALGKVAETTKKAGLSLADEARENVVLKSIGYHTAKPRKMLKQAGIKPEDMAAEMEKRGVMKGVKSTDDVIDNLNKLDESDSAKIGDTIKEIDDVTSKNQDPNSFLKSIIEYRQKVEDVLLDPKKTTAQDIVPTKRIVRQFTKGIDEKFLGGHTPQELAELSLESPGEYAKIVKKIQGQGFDDLYREKSGISKAIREMRGKNDLLQAEKAEDVDKVLLDTITSHVQRNAPDKQVAQDLLNKLSQDRRDMLFSRTAKKIAEDSIEREGKNRYLGLSDTILGASTASALASLFGPAALPFGFALGAGASKYARTKGLGAAYAPLKATERTLEKGALEKAAQGLTRGSVIAGGAAAGESVKGKKKEKKDLQVPSGLE